MKVLIANKFFFRNGGSEVVMFQEREFLRRSGVNVIDFSMVDQRNLESPYREYFVSAVNYTDARGLSKLSSALTLIHSPRAVRKFADLLDTAKPDIVHCHNIYHQLTPSIIGTAKSRGVPVVLTLHDFKPVCPVYTRLRNGQPCSSCLDDGFFEVVRNRCANGSFSQSALLYLEATAQRLMGNYENVDLFLAPSEFMRDAVLSRFPASKVVVLRNGVASMPTHGTVSDDEYVLYLGRLSSEKGVETLLRSQEASGGGWRLVVAGSGPGLESLKQRFPRATFMGHLTGPALEKVIAKASTVVTPSEWYENCPMSILEAMASGKPVVASRIGGIPEIVVDGETGLLFTPGDSADLATCLDRLMADSSLRKRMGKAARERAAREYSIESHNTQLMDIYKSAAIRN